MAKMICMVAYDISDPALERRVVKALKAYGMRYQYSIFVCHVTRKERMELTEKLTRLYNAYRRRAQTDKDTVFRIALLPLCETCRQDRTEIGESFAWPEGSLVVS